MSKLSITWLGHSTFILRTPGGVRLILDPWVSTNPSCPEDAKKVGDLNLMLVTHGHFDHTADVVSIARSTDAQVVAPFELSVIFQQRGLKNVVGMIGGTLKAHGLSITMVPAVHSSSIEDDGKNVYAGLATGYVIGFEDGLVAYYAGDTSIFSDMKLIGELYRLIAGLPANRGSVHDGTGAGGHRLRPAWGEAGDADALGNIPGADRHAGTAARTRGVEGVEVLDLKPGETTE